MADAYTIISGSVGQNQNDFEFEDTADGAETIDDTVDAGHIAIIINDEVPIKSGDIDALIHRLANNLRERGYT